MQTRWRHAAQGALLGLIALVGLGACTSPDVITLSMDPDPAPKIEDRDWTIDDGVPVDTNTGAGGGSALAESDTVPRFRTGSASELPVSPDASAQPEATLDPESISAPIVITPTPMITALPIVVVDPNNPGATAPGAGAGDVGTDGTQNTSADAGAEAPRTDTNTGARAMAAVVTKVRSGTVAITANECGATRNGTGFAIDSHHIVTAAHVIGAANSIQVTSSEYSGQAWLVNDDYELDLALLWVAEPMTGWEFSFAPTVKLGQEAAFLEYSPTGAFTATRTSVVAIDTNDVFENPVIKFGATAKSGDGGAPVVDIDGDVIGIINRARPYLSSIDHALYAANAKRFVAENSDRDPQAPAPGGCEDPPPPGFDGVRVRADHRQGEAVKWFFDAYISGINGGHPEFSWNLLSPQLQDSIGGYDRFAAGHKTSTIGNFTVHSIVDTDTGLAVEATFVSTQDGADGPNGWPCATWSMRYDVTMTETSDYLIDSAANLAGSPAACEP